MSAKLMGQVWELALPHNQQSVALALADHGDDDGAHIYPSQPYVAWKTGYTDRQVRTILRQLEEVGLIMRVTEATGHRPTEYRMVVTAVPVKPPFSPKTGSRFRAEDSSGRKPRASRAEVASSDEPSKEPSPSATAEGKTPRRKPEDDPDAVRLCGLLASHMRQNDPKAKVPKSGEASRDKWVRDMRLLVADRDGDIAEVEFVIRWCQSDDFWRSNILSPKKLREQFTALVLKATTDRERREHLTTAHDDPLAGLSPSARARMERTGRRMQVVNSRPTPPGEPHDPTSISGPQRPGEDRPCQPALASGQ